MVSIPFVSAAQMAPGKWESGDARAGQTPKGCPADGEGTVSVARRCVTPGGSRTNENETDLHEQRMRLIDFN